MRNLKTAGSTAPLAALVIALVSGCTSPPMDAGADRAAPGAMGHAMPAGMVAGRMAVATLTPTQGHAVRGSVMFHRMDGHLMVHARISGLKPGAEHGFHVHEAGNCASTDAASAGGHFHADGQPHGPPGAAHHTGDMLALKADANGNVDQKFTLASGPTLDQGPSGLIGRAVIVHAEADDYATQPTGNSGARVACGVIAGM